jgi:hypothetical protein
VKTQLTRQTWVTIALVSLMAVPSELAVRFGLWFSPGWANFGGTSIQVIWPIGLSVLFFLILMTAAVGIGAAAVAIDTWRRHEHSSRLLGFAMWLAAATVLALMATATYYADLRSSAMTLFPNGYNPK